MGRSEMSTSPYETPSHGRHNNLPSQNLAGNKIPPHLAAVTLKKSTGNDFPCSRSFVSITLPGPAFPMPSPSRERAEGVASLRLLL